MPRVLPGETVPRDKRDKKKPQAEAGPVTSPAVADHEQKLAAAEHSSRGTLTTDFVYGLALTASDSPHAARAAAAIAHQVDLPTAALELKYNTGPYAGEKFFIDPMTGQPTTLQRARQFMRGQLAQQLAVVLAREPKTRPAEWNRERRQARAQVDWNPQEVQAYFEVINNNVQGRIPGSQAITYAMVAARRGIPIDRLNRNLQLIEQRSKGSGAFTEAEAVDLALRAADGMRRDLTDRDVTSYMLNYGIQNVVAQHLNQSPDYRVASPIAEMALRQGISQGPGWWERNIAPIYAPIAHALGPVAAPIGHALADNPITQDVVEPLFHGFVEFSDAFVNEAYGALHAAGVVATGGVFEQGGLSGGLRNSWAYYTRQRRFGDDIAASTGATPGTADFAIRSAMAEFLFGWFTDPYVLTGWAVKASALQRVVGASGSALEHGTGIFRGFVDPGVAYSEFLDQAATTLVPGRWVRAATEGVEGARFGKSDWDLLDWLMREKNIDRMVDTPRGEYGLGPGMSKKTAEVIREYVDNYRRGVLDEETRRGVLDIYRVSFGMAPRGAIGGWAKTAMQENLVGKVAEQVDDTVRAVLESEPLRFGPKGAIERNQQRRLANAITKGLVEDVGLTRSRAQDLASLAVKQRAHDLGQLTPLEEIERANRAARVERVVEHPVTFAEEGGTGLGELVPQEEALRAAATNPYHVTWGDDLYKGLKGSERVIPEWGPSQMLRDARLSFRDSVFWRNRFAERVFHPFFHRAPPPIINIEQGALADTAFRDWLDGWGGLFDDQDKGRLMQEFVKLRSSPLATREFEWRHFMEQTFAQAFDRFGLPQDFIDKLMGVARPRYEYFSESLRRVYTPVRGAEDVASEVFARAQKSPLLESQLLNALALPNPLEVRRAVMDAFGSVEKVQAKAADLFDGLRVEDLSDGEQQRLIEAISAWRKGKIWTKEQLGPISEIFTRALKKLFILRPAWTVRVVAIDENLRAQVHLGSTVERVRSIAAGAEPETQAALGVARPRPIREIEVMGEKVPLQITPNIPDEPTVANITNVSRAYASVAEQERNAYQRLGVGVITPKARNYWPEYERVMNQELFQDPLAERILKAFTGDMSDGTRLTMDDVYQWALQNPREWALAKGAKIDMAERFRIARDHVLYLVGENMDVARATLHGEFSRVVARENLANNRLPDVVGDLATELMGGKQSLGQRAMGNLFEAFGARPSNFWNRLPLYREEFAREAERLLSTAAEEGTGAGLSRAELAAIRSGLEKGPTAGTSSPILLRAHEHAVQETQRIMFTMANRSQFAELHRLLIPFWGPFEEQFTAWAGLAWRNPRIIGRAFQIGKLAVDTGFVRKDEFGQLVITPKVYAPFAVLGDWLGGFKGTDWMPAVQGLNTFWGNTFAVPLPGGGHIPIPMPGFNWAFEALLKATIPDSWKDDEGWRGSIYAYTFAYGDRFSMIPYNYQRLFWAVAPMDSEQLRLVTDDVLRAAALQGMKVLTDPDAKSGPNEISYSDAQRQARAWLAYRGLVGTIFPTYPTISFEHDKARTEYYDWVQSTGSFDRADELWKQKYGTGPDSELALIGSRESMMPGPALPATEGVTELMNSPDFQKVLNMMPQLAFFLIPREVRDGEVDLDAYNQQVSDGLRAIRPPADQTIIYGSGAHTFKVNSLIVEHDVNQGWEEFFAEDDRFRAQLDAQFPKGIPDSVSDIGWTKYNTLLTAHEKTIRGIEEDHPLWAGRSAGQYQIDDPFYLGNVQMLRNVLQSDVFKNTQFGKAMAEYFDATEGKGGILSYMQKWNIRNLDTVAARQTHIPTAIKPVEISVTDPQLLESARAAVRTWNQAAGQTVLTIVPEGTKGAVPITIDQRPEKFADAEYSNTDHAVYGNLSALTDPTTLAHELGHALGLQHPVTGTTEEHFVPYHGQQGANVVPAIGLMGTEKGQRSVGPTVGEVQWVEQHADTFTLAGAYKNLIKDLKAKYGEDFTIPFQTFLEGRHLHDVTTSGMEHVAGLSPEYQQIYDGWKQRWLDAGSMIEHASGDDRRAREQRGYIERARLALEADQIADRFGDPKLNPQYIWYHDELNVAERREVKLNTAIKPYVFLTSFERREILGFDTSDDVEKAWVKIAQLRMQTERSIANNPDQRDHFWDQYNREVENIISVTPGMQAQKKYNRDWTWSLRHSLPQTWTQGHEGQAWHNLFQFSQDLDKVFHQADFVDDTEFQRVKNIMFDYIRELKGYSPDFKAHYNLLEGLGYGPGLIDTFLDPYWYLDF